VVFCALLAAASGAAAQKQEVVYSMTPNEAWPKMGTRVDGKLPAISFTFGTESAGAAGARTVAAQDAVLTIPAGEPAALWWRAALTMRHLAFVLIEFPLAVPKPPARAPFAIRLSDVVVTSVQLSKHSEDNRGSGTVEVKLRPARIEVFTATQDASGAVKPGPQFNWDFNKHSQF
jgi:hypothetical protein